MFPFIVGFKDLLETFIIPNHQTFFLRIAHGGAKRVEMTKIIKLYAFGVVEPPILISISLVRHVLLSCAILK